MKIIRRIAAVFQHFINFVTPMPDWAGRVQDRNSGCIVWPHPIPGYDKLAGFPIQWILAHADAQEPSGLSYYDHAMCAHCHDDIGDTKAGVRCARCGVPLHDGRCAGMQDSLAVPVCGWCRPLVRFFV